MNLERLRKQLKRKDLKGTIYTYSSLKQLIKLSRIIDKTFSNGDISKIKAFNEFGIIDWVLNYNKLKVFPTGSSLESQTLKYGEIEGLRRFNEKNQKGIHSEVSYIKKYGMNEGKEKWIKQSNKLKFSASLDGYIKKHGKELGKKKYQSMLDSKILTEEKLGTEEWDKFCKRNAYTNSLEYSIETYGTEKGTNRYNKIKSKDLRGDEGSSNKIGYWTKQGYNKEEAKEKVSERQLTFSLEKCIENYGETEGLLRFKERQEQWQITLNNKSKEEKLRINQLKGTGINAGWGIQKIRNIGIEKAKQIPCKLYYIRFYNNETEFWKIGITTKTINQRFGNDTILLEKSGLKKEVLWIEDSNWYEAFISEQSILINNKSKRIKVNEGYFSSSECFSENIDTNINENIYKQLEKKV